MSAGLDPARFWELTPRLFALEMEGAAARIRRDRELVWWGAMMPHMKRPPTLERFVAPPRKVERQSKEIMQAMCDALAAAWGAEKVIAEK